ncbi:hypothetical protein QBC37DRAFT_410760 [Rhypophila decipiens]|uniref:MICOS complex subunit MIC12 n=1 Tax=Rhypophila decipiens TaxID=261697 RepID=A0AAN7BD08_9PEZI|nr:hypothetical protein QBC37DRAFT_410760 [Rhypophila decipiens]
MGFVTGFTGGVTLTLAAAYLALSAHERTRLAQSDILQYQTRVLNNLSQDPSTRRPRLDNQPFPSRAELAAQQRGHLIETAKDKWNSEIESAVRWAQSTDWDSVRENAEDATARLLGIARESAVQTSSDAAGAIRKTSSEAAVAARNATNSAIVSAAETKEDLKTTLLRAKDIAAETAVGTKEESKGLIASAIEKGRHMVGKTKAAVHLAEEKIEARVDAKLLHVSEIEKALNERFEKPKVDPMSRSVEEVLAERYTPIDQRDNTRLRGI